MNEQHQQFQNALEELSTLANPDKVRFLEELLFYFTISSRGIWSDEKVSEFEKVEAFKWLNELCHRIWNIKFELQREESNDSITRLYENMKFYREQSELLRVHLVPTTLGAFRNFEAKQQEPNAPNSCLPK
ncbi:hypothetical protein [Paracnuella aquatica]|uniref:hypothetical protein n=1 Tax=Paracnuella aquatica TaxID=2268757 RepID=UPI000DEF55EC|nr:hypothetical protein [Paracnuella aquatica]RPD43411.1 hypothetical protein DRJ53_20330 [Paracnuella aquatica]